MGILRWDVLWSVWVSSSMLGLLDWNFWGNASYLHVSQIFGGCALNLT